MPYNTEYLTDVYEFELLGEGFSTIKLMHYLKAVSDKIAFRNAVHEFIKRDGASIESMGRKAAEFRFTCFYNGPNWRIRYNNLVSFLSKNSKVDILHPLLGPLRVACDLIEGSSTFGTGRDLVEFTLTFTEDRVDMTLGSESEPKLMHWTSDAASSIALAVAIAKALYKQAGPVIGLLSGSVSTFVATAETSITDIAAAAKLPSLVASVGRGASLAIAAVLANQPAGSVDADSYDILTAIETSHSSCLNALAAIEAQIALPTTRVVTAAAPLVSLCQNWYPGKDSYRYSQDIERLNPNVPDFGWIPQGTTLLIPPPTIGAP